MTKITTSQQVTIAGSSRSSTISRWERRRKRRRNRKKINYLRTLGKEAKNIKAIHGGLMVWVVCFSAMEMVYSPTLAL